MGILWEITNTILMQLITGETWTSHTTKWIYTALSSREVNIPWAVMLSVQYSFCKVTIYLIHCNKHPCPKTSSSSYIIILGFKASFNQFHCVGIFVSEILYTCVRSTSKPQTCISSMVSWATCQKSEFSPSSSIQIFLIFGELITTNIVQGLFF